MSASELALLVGTVLCALGFTALVIVLIAGCAMVRAEEEATA